MPVGIFRPGYGTQKPGLPAQIDRSNPLAAGLEVAVLFNQCGAQRLPNAALGDADFAGSALAWGLGPAGAHVVSAVTTFANKSHRNIGPKFSAFAWFNPSQTASVRVIGAHDSGANNGWRFSASQNMAVTFGGVSDYAVTANGSIVAGHWHKGVVTCTGSAGTASGYVLRDDGAYSASTATPGTMGGTPSRMSVGTDLFTNTVGFQGNLAMYLVWGRCLTAGEARAIIDNPLGLLCRPYRRLATVPDAAGAATYSAWWAQRGSMLGTGTAA